MKRIYKNGLVFIVLTLFLLISINPVMLGEKTIKSNNLDVFLNQNNDKWTWIFYDDEDFPTGVSILDRFSEYAFSRENLDIIVLTDTYNGPANIWYIDENHERILLQQMGEVNMGNYQTLRDFIKYSKENFPASRYLLSLYNHGNGWEGSCWDGSNNDDFLSMDEIKTALTETGNVDIVAFTGPCLMSSMECVYELRNNTDIYLGSEAIGFFDCWRYSIFDICNLLNQYPETDCIDVGKRIIELIRENNNGREFDPVSTISAFRTDKIINFTQSFDSILYDLCNNYEKEYYKICNIRKDIQSFPRSSHSYLVDVYDFLEKNLENTTNQSFITKIIDSMNLFNELIIDEYHGDASIIKNVHGSSLYFPDPPGSLYDLRYDNPDFGLDFCEDTYWDEFIEMFLEMPDNFPPQKPSIRGPLSGKINQELLYYTTSEDSEDDQLCYFFDWGDDTDSNWIGPYDSGEEIEASHIWTEEGSYQIKVKARDIHGLESDWSEPLPVSMPKNRVLVDIDFLRIFEFFKACFTFLFLYSTNLELDL